MRVARSSRAFIERAGLLGGVLLLFVVGGAAISLRQASSTAAAEGERARHAIALSSIPAEAFTRDGANRFSGRVVDTSGIPIAGAQVQVYAKTGPHTGRIRFGTIGKEAVTLEASGQTDELGRYEFRSLTYGSKVVLARHPGFLASQVSEISFVDGYGARNIDATLLPAAPSRIQIVDSSGDPLTKVPVTFQPRFVRAAWPSISGSCISDEDGWIDVPASVRSSLGQPRLLVGHPCALVESVREDGRAVVSPRLDLVIEFLGSTRPGASVTVLPAGVEPLPSLRTELEVDDRSVTIADLAIGRYDVLVEQGGEATWARIEHSSDSSLLQLSHRTAQVQLSRSAVLGSVSAEARMWQPQFRSARSLVELFAESEASIRAVGATITSSDLDPVAVGGWVANDARFVVESAAASPQLARLAEDASTMQIELVDGVEVSIRTSRPFLPIAVEAADLLWGTGRSDAFGEAIVRLPSGPVVVTTGFPFGGVSYPKGVFVSAEPSRLSFSVLDDRGEPSGCIYGFVLDEDDRPVSGAEVFLQGAGPPVKKVADDGGYYRFTGLGAGAYVLFARRDSASSEYQELLSVLLTDSDLDRHQDVMQNCRLWSSVVSLKLMEGVESPTLSIMDDSEVAIWTSSRVVDGQLRISNLPPGEYRALLATDSDLDLEIGSFSISEAGDDLVELKWMEAR